MHRTLRWIDRCIKAHKRPHDQNLFGIVQGFSKKKKNNFNFSKITMIQVV